MWWLIDSLDVEACVGVVVFFHVLTLGLVVMRTYSSAMRHQTPLRSAPVTMVQNGVSETQWRDGWARQLGLWAVVFSAVPAVLYVLLFWLAVSRWMPLHEWVVPVLVVVMLCLVAVGLGVWAWRSHLRHEARQAVPVVEGVEPARYEPIPYSEPYGTWRDDEGL